jgi:NAD(P)-dependent dehydrogenase (short-subunit alcohol dehydrogenase family)
MELTDVKVLVTGGVSGIGLAVSQLFAEQGAQLAVLDRADVADAARVLPDGAVYVCADVTNGTAVAEAMAEAIRRLGGLDVLVNNAGIGAAGGIEANDDEEWHHVFDVNVVGIARVTRAALPALRRSQRAAIVNTSSIAATAGLPNRALYSATKGAVAALTRAMAADLMADGIRVNAVNPGTTDTPWVGRLLDVSGDPASERQALEARQPHGRLVTAAEVAHAVAYLAAPSSGSTTGTALAIDGGMGNLRLPAKRQV